MEEEKKLMCLLLCRLCESHMLAHMEPSNCVGVYQWARVLGATCLADHALKYTCQHFTQVTLSSDSHMTD